MATNQVNRTRCEKCDMDDTAEMIHCELCYRREHFGCAGVPDGFNPANSTWCCQQCEAEKIAANVPRSTRSSTSSRRSLRLKLALEELEVRNRLRMKEIEAEKEFFKQKYELLKQMEDEDDRESRRSIVSEKTKRERLEKWLAKHPNGVETTGGTKSADISQEDATIHQLEHTPQSSSTLNRIVEETPVPAVVSQCSIPAVGPVQLNSSLLGGTILTPADMDISANNIVSNEPPPPVVARSSAAICFSTPVAITSSNLVNPLPAAISTTGNFQHISGKQSAAHPIQKASISVQHPSQWDTSQVTTEGNVANVRGNVQPTIQSYSREVHSGIQSGVTTAPMQSHEQIPSWVSNKNIGQRSLHTDNEHPSGVYPVSSTMSEINGPYFGSQFRHNLGGTFPSSVYTSGTQPLPSYPAAGQYSVVHLVPPGMIPPQQPPAIWPVQQPRTIVQSGVHFSSPIVAPSVAVPSTETRENATVRMSTAERSSSIPGTSFVVPPSSRSFAPRGTTSYTPLDNEHLQRQNGPTASQIAARQVISRDLPTFSGNPEDWPIFFSSFQNSTETCGYSDAENLARLQRCLRGAALEAVRSRLLLPASVPNVIETLHKLYGKPENLINSLLRKVRNTPSPKSDNLHSIITFGLAVQNLVDHIIIAEQDSHLANPMLLQELMGKLPTSLKLQWGAFKRSYADVNLTTFNEFMVEMVDLASDLTVNEDAPSGQKQQKEERSRRKEKLFVHSHEELKETEKIQDLKLNEQAKLCSNCGVSGHQILQCINFKAMSVEDRWKAIRQRNLCRSCLIPHRKWPCRSKKECGKDGCTSRHHWLLHEPRKTLPQQNAATTTTRSTGSTQVAHQNHHFDQSYSLFRYVPITVYGNGKQIDIYAFLDEGSSTTMIETGVADLLEVNGPKESLWLTWTGEITREEKESRIISIAVAGAGINRKFSIGNVRTVEELKLPRQSFCYEVMAEKYPHLRRIPIKSYHNATPRMIIGIEHVRLLTSQKLREGKGEGPVAVKTRLGWSVFGRQTEEIPTVERVNFHHSESLSNRALHDSMKQFFRLEESTVTTKMEAEEDKRARQLLEQRTVRTGSRFETGLLWKVDNPSLPNSFPMALQRLKSLERKLARDPGLRQRVKDQINGYLAKNYAHKASEQELEDTNTKHSWYLPLGVVENPKKPGKTRLIWDAAAKVQGISLNDLLLKGPDLLTSLLAVLMRFRQHNIAVSGDIAEMFHQIRIRDDDKQFQRFLWRDDPEDEVQVYVMDVATFGATCSPCTAQYIKNRNALEFAESFPRAVEGIIKNHYVDDFLDSVNTEEEAVELVGEVKMIHAAAGFQIGKFQSNSSTVLSRLGEPVKTDVKSLNLDKQDGTERILGMVWSVTADVFTFDTLALPSIQQLVKSGMVPTKRQVLRAVMSLFDPLGLVAHYVVHGKILMQEIWRSGTEWDEPIAGHLHDTWYRWIELLYQLSEVRVPRCYFSGEKLQHLQLHVFVDASEMAYAGVAYLRVDSGTERKCTLVMAKTKVSPLKPLSVPRLELQAAMLGARLAQSIGSSLTIPIEHRYFWSDSSTVLSWLSSQRRRYHQFVEFRVAEILSLTCIDEWRYVPTKLNVADIATKWGSGPSFQPHQEWYLGPAFLYQPNEAWPINQKVVGATIEELRPMFLHHEKIMERTFDWTRFSNWNRLIRTAAYVYRAIAIFKRRRNTRSSYKILQKDEFAKAEAAVVRQIQAEEYPDEIALLGNNSEERSLSKSSVLYALSLLSQPLCETIKPHRR